MRRTTKQGVAMVVLGAVLTLGGCAGSMSSDGMMKKDGMAGDKMSGDKGMMKDDKGATMEKK